MARSALMGPVLGAVVGGALGGMIGRLAQGGEERGTVHARWGDRPLRTLGFAEAFGRHWVRVEVSKLLGLYRAYGSAGASDGPASLPGRGVAASYLLATAAAGAAHSQEAEDSGTRDFDRIERPRELADIHDSLEATAKESWMKSGTAMIGGRPLPNVQIPGWVYHGCRQGGV